LGSTHRVYYLGPIDITMGYNSWLAPRRNTGKSTPLPPTQGHDGASYPPACGGAHAHARSTNGGATMIALQLCGADTHTHTHTHTCTHIHTYKHPRPMRARTFAVTACLGLTGALCWTLFVEAWLLFSRSGCRLPSPLLICPCNVQRVGAAVCGQAAGRVGQVTGQRPVQLQGPGHR
jgi:hypothetical protein